MVVIPFRLPAHAPPEPLLHMQQEPALSHLVEAPPLLHMQHLPLSAADREALLAALEIGISVSQGNGGAARRMALAYPAGELSCQLDSLADRVFALGRRPQVDVWQQVIGPKS